MEPKTARDLRFCRGDGAHFRRGGGKSVITLMTRKKTDAGPTWRRARQRRRSARRSARGLAHGRTCAFRFDRLKACSFSDAAAVLEGSTEGSTEGVTVGMYDLRSGAQRWTTARKDATEETYGDGDGMIVGHGSGASVGSSEGAGVGTYLHLVHQISLRTDHLRRGGTMGSPTVPASEQASG